MSSLNPNDEGRRRLLQYTGNACLPYGSRQSRSPLEEPAQVPGSRIRNRYPSNGFPRKSCQTLHLVIGVGVNVVGRRPIRARQFRPWEFSHEYHSSPIVEDPIIIGRIDGMSVQYHDRQVFPHDSKRFQFLHFRHLDTLAPTPISWRYGSRSMSPISMLSRGEFISVREKAAVWFEEREESSK